VFTAQLQNLLFGVIANEMICLILAIWHVAKDWPILFLCLAHFAPVIIVTRDRPKAFKRSSLGFRAPRKTM
jgi:hypothetical protein